MRKPTVGREAQDLKDVVNVDVWVRRPLAALWPPLPDREVLLVLQRPRPVLRRENIKDGAPGRSAALDVGPFGDHAKGSEHGSEHGGDEGGACVG